MARRILLALSLFFILTFPIWAVTAIHNTGQINLTIDDDGGYSGWRSLTWGSPTNHLYAASFMLGISPSETVLDGRRLGDHDWTTTTAVSITESGSTADEEGSAVYGNTLNNFSIAQHSYAWTSSPNDDFVILKYVVTNTGTTTQTIYLGIWIDYDVDTGTSDDYAAYDSSRYLAYIYDTNYAGIRLLSGAPRSCNIQIFDEPNTDSERYSAMINGEFDAAPGTTADYTLVLSAGPFTLAPDGSTTFGMAYVMGSSLGDLQDNADAAQTRYDFRLGGGGGGGGGASGSVACFIATAAYSGKGIGESEKGRIGESHRFTVSPVHPVNILRRFRDEYLLTNTPGRAFVAAYYRISPPVADFIRDKEVLKAIVRFYLKPIMWLAEKATLNNE